MSLPLLLCLSHAPFVALWWLSGTETLHGICPKPLLFRIKEKDKVFQYPTIMYGIHLREKLKSQKEMQGFCPGSSDDTSNQCPFIQRGWQAHLESATGGNLMIVKNKGWRMRSRGGTFADMSWALWAATGAIDACGRLYSCLGLLQWWDIKCVCSFAQRRRPIKGVYLSVAPPLGSIPCL